MRAESNYHVRERRGIASRRIKQPACILFMHGLQTSQLFDDNIRLRFMLQDRYALAAFAIFYPQRLLSERSARIWRAS
jgi:hypothetical protein